MTMDNAHCVSCGMPLRTAEDHALDDPTRDYCRHCARADGTMKSYDEALAGISGFLCHTQGLDQAVARQMAAEMMARLPAWRDR
jgi:hypothetical protein